MNRHREESIFAHLGSELSLRYDAHLRRESRACSQQSYHATQPPPALFFFDLEDRYPLSDPQQVSFSQPAAHTVSPAKATTQEWIHNSRSVPSVPRESSPCVRCALPANAIQLFGGTQPCPPSYQLQKVRVRANNFKFSFKRRGPMKSLHHHTPH